MTRRILEIATHGRVRDGANGGIILDAEAAGVAEPQTTVTEADSASREVMRGGTTIGYLERLAVVIALIAGYPEAIAIVVAVKGVGRFSELAAAEARGAFHHRHTVEPAVGLHPGCARATGDLVNRIGRDHALAGQR